MLSKIELTAIDAVLDKLDHYRILKLATHASDEEVRNAFHREALALHPDQYQHLKDPEILNLSKKIYSRVIEAYRTLSSTERRQAYDLELKKSGRLDSNASKKEKKVEAETDFNEVTSVRKIEKTATTTAGLKFFKMAQAAYQSKDLNSAKMNIQIALNTDKANPEYLDLLARIESEVARKKK